MNPEDSELKDRPSRAKKWTILSILLAVVMIGAVILLYGNLIRMNCESSSLNDFFSDVRAFHTSRGC